ncbi:uncharacterized protein TrAtP1_001767 [Trichoderma atroviride]|uniref:uncharacterized protein n=1 Tax=Hypocrea atroviridis TaxID=63577 RepID=UPI00331EB2DF|nr:hypothetical protein TrAtP1_001767 [Trichoderma atroviride]
MGSYILQRVRKDELVGWISHDGNQSSTTSHEVIKYMQPNRKEGSFELSSHPARVGMRSSAGYVRVFHSYETCTASLLLTCFLFSAVFVVCRHSVGNKKRPLHIAREGRVPADCCARACT